MKLGAGGGCTGTLEKGKFRVLFLASLFQKERKLTVEKWLVLASDHEEALSIGGVLALVNVAHRVLVLNVTGAEDDALLAIVTAVSALASLEILIAVAQVGLGQWDGGVEGVDEVVYSSLVVAGNQSAGALKRPVEDARSEALLVAAWLHLAAVRVQIDMTSEYHQKG